jgi:hypothetical protein
MHGPYGSNVCGQKRALPLGRGDAYKQVEKGANFMCTVRFKQTQAVSEMRCLIWVQTPAPQFGERVHTPMAMTRIPKKINK